MRLYLAGPMSGLPDHNFPAFYRAEARLTLAGYSVLNPARLDGEDGAMPWGKCLIRDLDALYNNCHGVALLPGWASSKGARIEHDFAVGVGLPVAELHFWLAPTTIKEYLS